MTLDQLANMAEVFGILVVAVTFIFLTIQTRQNTKAQRSSTAQSANEMAMSIYKPIVAGPDVAELVLRGLRDPESLTDVETMRFTAHWQNSLFTWQNWFYQRNQGALDDGIWLGFSKVLVDVLQTPGLANFWQHRRHYFSDEFRMFVETEILTQKSTPGYRILGAGEDPNMKVSES